MSLLDELSIDFTKVGAPSEKFEEVSTGLNLDSALLEASRCLQCYEPPCRKGCPVRIDVPVFIRRIKEGDFAGAAQKIKEANLLGGICARVCPVERLCEMDCTRKKMDRTVQIKMLQRFATDWEEENWKKAITLSTERDERIAVVGAGPAGLSCAYELRKMGFRVTIFERSENTGGIPSWGIPPFRMPRVVVQSEANFAIDTGIELICGKDIVFLDDLKQDYDAIFLGIGLADDIQYKIEGSAECIFSSNQFLRQAEKNKLPDLTGKKIGIIGGGDVAFDAARTAMRLGGESVILYRRTFKEMPAEQDEISAAIDEGIDFKLLTTVTEFIHKTGGICTAKCQVMELGPMDRSGRRRPLPVEGAYYNLDLDYLVWAIGSKLDLDFCSMNQINVDRKGRIEVDENLMTNRGGVFAGGDSINKQNMVVRAVAEGKRAASNISKYLEGGI
ncbi:MAG: FAD-dependent oxidoreductase [Candidatus Thermoplasmatota archaeon]|nr:FAD-dependent oxidoreductase [Candidatus Thermoplasmatota archaeon]